MLIKHPRFCVRMLCGFVLLLLSGCSLPAFGNAPKLVPPPFYTLKGGGPCVQLGAHPQPPYTNVRVSHDTFLAHSEPEIAENPNNPLDLVGGSKFFTNIDHYYHFKIGYFTSSDGGCTWTDGGILPGFDNEPLLSDVSFAFGTHDDAYVAVLNTDNKKESGVSVSTSHDGGKTFGPPVRSFEDTTGKVFSDKPWIGVDQTNGPTRGNIYVVWSYDYESRPPGAVGACDFIAGPPCSQELGFARSTDGGKTFSPATQIEGSAPFCTNPWGGRPPGSHRCDAVLGATPVIGPDGTIAVAFAYVDLNQADPESGAGSTDQHDGAAVPTKLLVVTSHDGGLTWSTPTLIATVHDIPFQFSQERYRNATLPAFVSDPRTGQLYIAWNDERNGDADIYLSTSTDRGQTWSAPVRVNDDPVGDHANQFQPQLAVAPDGVVSVSFFDTRNDPAHKLIDVYLAQSVDHGKSFLPNVRVTTQNWNPAVNAPVVSGNVTFIGDYQGVSADDHFVHPFWNDTRTGDQEIFTAAIPSARPTP